MTAFELVLTLPSASRSLPKRFRAENRVSDDSAGVPPVRVIWPKSAPKSEAEASRYLKYLVTGCKHSVRFTDPLSSAWLFNEAFRKDVDASVLRNIVNAPEFGQWCAVAGVEYSGGGLLPAQILVDALESVAKPEVLLDLLRRADALPAWDICVQSPYFVRGLKRLDAETVLELGGSSDFMNLEPSSLPVPPSWAYVDAYARRAPANSLAHRAFCAMVSLVLNSHDDGADEVPGFLADRILDDVDAGFWSRTPPIGMFGIGMFGIGENCAQTLVGHLKNEIVGKMGVSAHSPSVAQVLLKILRSDGVASAMGGGKWAADCETMLSVLESMASTPAGTSPFAEVLRSSFGGSVLEMADFIGSGRFSFSGIGTCLDALPVEAMAKGWVEWVSRLSDLQSGESASLMLRDTPAGLPGVYLNVARGWIKNGNVHDSLGYGASEHISSVAKGLGPDRWMEFMKGSLSLAFRQMRRAGLTMTPKDRKRAYAVPKDRLIKGVLGHLDNAPVEMVREVMGFPEWNAFRTRALSECPSSNKMFNGVEMMIAPTQAAPAPRTRARSIRSRSTP